MLAEFLQRCSMYLWHVVVSRNDKHVVFSWTYIFFVCVPLVENLAVLIVTRNVSPLTQQSMCPWSTQQVNLKQEQCGVTTPCNPDSCS